MDKEILEVLDMIIADCESDVREFEGRPFNGKTLGELHGILEAKIQALAKIIKVIAETTKLVKNMTSLRDKRLKLLM